MCYEDFFSDKLQTSVATVLEKVKVTNHFTTGYICTKIKTQPVVKRLSNQKELQCFVPHLCIGSSTERGFSLCLLFLFWVRAFFGMGKFRYSFCHPAGARARLEIPELQLS